MDLLNLLLDWAGTDTGLCFSFGFSVYALFMVWRKLAARWINWFPLAAKATRLTLYIAAFGVAILGFQAIGANLLGFPNLFVALSGAITAPLVNTLARHLRPKEKVRRGAEVGLPVDVNKQTAKLPEKEFQDSFTIGGVKIPRSAEPYHFFVVGSTGSGKSVAITQVLDEIEKRGDLALVVDSGGEFCSRYYQPGRDHILNPFDDRCAPWSPTAELDGPWDAEALSKSMIPDGVGESKEWNGYAQTFVTAIMRKLGDQKRLSIKELLYYALAAPVEELKPLLAGTAAASHLQAETTLGGIRTIASSYLGTYSYLNDDDSPFSIAKFIKAERPGFAFITYRDDQLDSLKNMIGCILDVAARTILSLPPDSDRRVWLIIDEFASIGKVQSIEAVATKARKVGGCLLLGLQSISQLNDRYGDQAAQTILSCLSSWLVLRCSDVETSDYISRYIGEAEISRMNRGEASADSGNSDSLSEQITTQRAVMPVELQRLPNLGGFFKLAGDYKICSIKLALPKKRGKKAEAQKMRDFVAKPMLSLVSEERAQPLVDEAKQTPATHESVSIGQTEPDAEARPLVTLRVMKNQFDDGPDALEAVLNEMAEEHENGV